MQATGSWPDEKQIYLLFSFSGTVAVKNINEGRTPSSAYVNICIYIFFYFVRHTTAIYPISFLCGAHVYCDRRLVSACCWMLQSNVFTHFWRKDYSLKKLQAVVV